MSPQYEHKASHFDDSDSGYGSSGDTVNLARFDLISIRLAIFCAETGSLSTAARRANMSLSRASYRLSTLEDCLGQRLFNRHPQGMELTRAGAVLVSHGQQLLRTIAQLGDSLALMTEQSVHR